MTNHLSRNRFVLLLIFAVFTPSPFYGQTILNGTFTDSRDGQTYKTVKIGGSWWMAQNLNYATEKGNWCNENDADGSQFGRFYNWETAKKVSPAGWHLPSKKEFQNLLDSLGVNDDELFRKLLNGGESGLNALLTGSHRETYGRKGMYAHFWSSTLCWFSSLFRISEDPWRLCLCRGDDKSFAQIGHSAGSFNGFNSALREMDGTPLKRTSSRNKASCAKIIILFSPKDPFASPGLSSAANDTLSLVSVFYL